jgi:ABC-2 type transport system permease protein
VTSAKTLFGHECARVLKSSIIWAVLGLLGAAGTWGALNTARLHRDQAADLATLTAHENEWYADVRLRAARYATPSEASVPYWQDPTSASGFSRYFLKRFSAKPHLSLSALAVGHSDLQPFVLPIRLETLFGGDRVYDFEPPRALATGPFDLSFVLIFVLPLAVGAAVAAIGAEERDQRILPLVAAQPVSARQWWATRLAALAVVFVPGMAIVVALALTLAGVQLVDNSLVTLAALALVSSHVLFWIAIAGACLVRGYGAIATASTVAGAWIVLTIAVPVGGSLAVRAIGARPSVIMDVDELRRVTDDVQRDADGVVRRRLVARLGDRARTVDPAGLDYSTRLVLITEEMEERLRSQDDRRRQSRRQSARIASVIDWISPPVAFQTALSDLAGTGTARHERFLEATRAFQLELREFMYPHVLAQVGRSDHESCYGCPGRLTFVDYDLIPQFKMPEEPSQVRVKATLVTAGWLALLAAVIAGVGIARAQWRMQS